MSTLRWYAPITDARWITMFEERFVAKVLCKIRTTLTEMDEVALTCNRLPLPKHVTGGS